MKQIEERAEGRRGAQREVVGTRRWWEGGRSHQARVALLTFCMSLGRRAVHAKMPLRLFD